MFLALLASSLPLGAQSITLHRKSKKPEPTVDIPSAAQRKPVELGSTDQKLTVDGSETMFAILAAMNACGYDQELENSDLLRKLIRGEVAENVATSQQAAAAQQQLCSFYKDHDLGDPSRTLSQYISLALTTSPPPKFSTTVRESDLPPDASQVLGMLPLLQRFYDAAKLHDIWMKHQRDYAAFIYRMHDPLHNMLTRTDLYFKVAFTGVSDRRFAVIVDPQAAPGQVNARNYGNDYFVVVSPAPSGMLKMDEIRHTYLHYLLDRYALARGRAMQRLEPLLYSVSTAPLDDAYKNDISLLVIESLIRATEARMMVKPTVPGGAATAAKDSPEAKKQAEERRAKYEAQQLAVVNHSMAQGFILTRYFYDRLGPFELSPTDFKDEFGEMLYQIDVNEIKKAAQQTPFESQGSADVLSTRKQQPQAKGAELAEQKLAAGDLHAAQQLAQEAIDANGPDTPRGLFVMALVSSKQGQMQDARSYFERTLTVAKEPHLIAWSHIYLGRIYDLQDNREAALMHYSAALNSGDTGLDTKAAAQRGLDHPLVAKHSD